MRLPNVVGTGIGYKIIDGQRTREKAITVFVKKKVPREELPRVYRIPRRLDDLPTDIVEVGQIRLLNEQTQRYRPAPPGCSIGHYLVTAGTFGAVVYDEHDGTPLILSNNHVLANSTSGSDQRASIGDPILQPGSYDGGTIESDIIAHLERFVPLEPDVQESTCQAAGQFQNLINNLIYTVRPQYFVKVYKRKTAAANLVDAAVAKPVKTSLITGKILGIGRVTGTTEPEIDMMVKKSGRTTGLTYGTITHIDVSINVDYGEDRQLPFEDQILATNMSKPGDSGSLVLTDDNKAVGLLFAGSDRVTVLNRISNVMRLLRVNFGTG